MRERITYLATIAILVLAVIFMMKVCSSKDYELQIVNQNMEALMDSTRLVKNKLGQEQYEKKMFMGDVETLKKLNADLVKEADAQNGNTRVVTKVVTQIVFDTIRVENKVDMLNDSTYLIGFKYNKDYDSANAISFNGSVPATVTTEGGKLSLKSKTTTISDMSMKMKLYTGVKEENGSYSIFARTDFPGVKFDLDGAIIDPEKSFVDKKKGPFSVMFGAGAGYGLTSNGTGVFPSVGVFVGINLFHF
jgi:hypothetical protein